MRVTSARLAAAACLLTACSGGSGGGGGDAPFGLEQREEVTTLTFPSTGPQPGAFSAARAFPGLSFASPSFLTHAGDGTDRLFVCELAGRIRVFDNDEAATTSDVFLDIRARVVDGGERGLLGLAFDPDYASNGYFYVHYSGSAGGASGVNHRTFVSRFQVSAGDPNVADPGSETVLLTADQPGSNHNGGALTFGPDGMLYVALGDGGHQHDPDDRAQDLTSIFGKILRLTPGGGIPADNPFVGQGGSVREEIWAYGFRNPWRMSFDRNNGDLWVGDVGQDDIEEVTLVERGGNHGWDVYEGTRGHEDVGSLDFADTVPPVFEYDHSLGRSITGGYVYRGVDQPSLVGAYLYADYVTRRIWALVWDGVSVVSNVEIAAQADISSFGEDEAGELYLCSLDGNLYRLEETGGGSGPTFPQRLSDTGLFLDTANLIAEAGVVEYDVNTPLWSDGARKRRWIAVPGSTRIQFHPTEAWSFPLGTVLVKHFEIETAPGTTLRLETRVLVHETNGWQGYTYRWNAQQDDADLLPGSDSVTFTVQDPAAPGGQRQQTWNFPSRPECFACHTTAAGEVLGVRAPQLNREFAYPQVSDNQLRSWNHIGLFTTDIGDSAAYGALPAFADASLAADLRARAYLDVNCAQCHRPFGSTPVDIDLRFGVPAAQTNTVFAVPNAGDLGLVSPFIVAPGSKESSVLWERMRRLDTNRMPPLGSNEVDAQAVEVVGQWIDDGAN